MKRNVDKELLNWKHDPEHKALLVRGARQVGKTYSIRKLGETFKYFLEINFEETPDAKIFFERTRNPQELCEKLSIYFDIPIIPGETLLFLDEIQACLGALKSLRFFYEKMPQLHVVAAGSLLEFAIEEIPSFGVGRITSIFMYPMNFNEYLIASGSENMAKFIIDSSPQNPVDPLIHEKILDKLRTFQVIGGMPETVAVYLKYRDLRRCQKVLDDLITSIIDDFAKYKKRAPVHKLQEVFYSTVHQAGGKFKYSNVSPAGGSTGGYKEALDLIIKSGIAHKVCHTSARGLPLGAQVNLKKFKILPLDTGVYQRVLGLDLSQHIISDFNDLINRGNLSELFVGIELISHQSPYLHPRLYYWHREAKSSNAEVDYIVSHGSSIIPIEVKAGTRGQMQSLHLFLTERNLSRGLRISAENHAVYDNIQTLPIYAVSNIFQDGRMKQNVS
ncbi:MAG: ATP-binding protein [bacterium]|nr:ATP-binding protein [bacterium]